MNWVRHGGSTTFETKSSYCWVARQGLSCYMAVARLGFKRHAITVLKSNLIWSIELGTAVAWRLKRALIFLSQSRVIKQTVSFSLMKSSYIFSKHRLIRTMDTFLCPETQTVIYRQPHFMDTGYQCTFCLFSLYQSCANSKHWTLVVTILLLIKQ